MMRLREDINADFGPQQEKVFGLLSDGKSGSVLGYFNIAGMLTFYVAT